MRLKNIEQYRTSGTGNHMELSIPVPKTPDGRVYRYSPNEKASPRHFLIGTAPQDFVPTEEAKKRMKLTPRSKQVCPYSGVIAADSDFTHPDDIKAARELVSHAAHADVADAVHKMFEDLGRKFSSSKFIKVETRRPTPKPRPRFYRRDLLRELVCDHCQRDYGVFAIGLFCPDCGAPNLKLHFARETELVAKQVELADKLEDQEELAYRLMGNAHEDVLTAFEATQKAAYLYGIDKMGGPAKPVGNDFQNIKRAQARFAELGLDPFAALSADELADLNLNIQKRHIIGHNLGIMDEKFADHAANARIGETVRLVGEDILRFGALAQAVVGHLDDWLVSGTPTGAVVTPAAIPEPEKKEEIMVPGLSELAVNVAKWIAQNSVDGLTQFVNSDAMRQAFADADPKSLEDAVAELSTDGYITTTRTMGSSLPHIRPTLELYTTFDPILEIGTPLEDALTLIPKILPQDSVNVGALFKEMNWSLRRFNPAIAIVIAQIDDRRVGKDLSSEYPARFFHVLAEDRVALKRFAARLAG